MLRYGGTEKEVEWLRNTFLQQKLDQAVEKFLNIWVQNSFLKYSKSC